jgi:hypothetical protein
LPSTNGKSESGSLCPSAPVQEGALLLGRFNANGTLAFAVTPLPVSAEFIVAAAEAGDIGKRFRFSAPCMQRGCSRWQEGTCTVATAAAQVASQSDGTEDLPTCFIRSQCRWFQQEGDRACRICPHVVYDMRSAEENDDHIECI